MKIFQNVTLFRCVGVRTPSSVQEISGLADRFNIQVSIFAIGERDWHVDGSLRFGHSTIHRIPASHPDFPQSTAVKTPHIILIIVSVCQLLF